jgi:uncharacterized protein HemX
MAEVVYSLLDCDVKVRLNIKCETLDRYFEPTQSETREFRKSVSEGSALELKLDIDELQELLTMRTRLSNRNYKYNATNSPA